MSDLKALSISAEKNRELYQYQAPDPGVLETFPNPGSHTRVVLECKEHTSLCPITRQPDFATVTISYHPSRKCLETKSLKLYLMGYRNFGAFAETSAVMIRDHLSELLDPESLEVEVRFESRGGVSIRASASC